MRDDKITMAEGYCEDFRQESLCTIDQRDTYDGDFRYVTQNEG